MTRRMISISWNAVPNAERYSVCYKLASETTWKNVNAGTKTSCTVTGLEPNAKYDLRIKAIGDGVDYESVYSNIVSVKTATTDLTFYVSWAPLPNASGYIVMFKPCGENSWTSVNVGKQTDWAISSLELGVEYDFQIKAIRNNGYEYLSNFTVLAAYNPQPTVHFAQPIPIGHTTICESSALFDLGDDLFDDLDENDFNLLAANFVA